MISAFIHSVIDAINAVQAKVWQIAQFAALLILAGYGAHVAVAGHAEVGMAIVSGAFALLKFEVTGKDGA